MKQPLKPLEILRERIVHTSLAAAWMESNPGLMGGHEEGGFVAIGEDDKLAVQRWPKGEGNLIEVPSHEGCEVNGLPIVATFHTHPNIGTDYLQEPSETDKRGVREDNDLKSSRYIGEFVITNDTVYLVTPSGTVRELGARVELLS